jgi:hypothetical protein
LKTSIILIVVLLLTSSCLHQNIENRCLNNNLRVELLTIEDIGDRSHAKVRCYSSIEDDEDVGGR